MTHERFSRRDVLRTGFAAMAAGLASSWLPHSVLAGQVFPGHREGEETVPFLDVPPAPKHRLDWGTLDSWITPEEQIFNVQHYGIPEVDAQSFKLEITGLVGSAKTFTLDELKALPRRDQLMTLECSGSGVSKNFMNAIYNGKWTGTPLAPILRSCGIRPGALEAVFFGADRKEETLREGTKRELKIEVPFGRSMSLEDVLGRNPLLAYELNGKPIETRNGAPLRLIVPGWYGIANVKWLHRIDVRDRRYMGRYMGRDYVTVRGERHGGEVVFIETSVTRMNLKSIVARVTRGPSQSGQVPLQAHGAVWSDGTEIQRVEVKVDDGPWQKAELAAEPRSRYCWIFFSADLGRVPPGKHVVVSRAIDVNGRVQPSAEDDEIALKKTYWEANQQWPREIEV